MTGFLRETLGRVNWIGPQAYILCLRITTTTIKTTTTINTTITEKSSNKNTQKLRKKSKYLE